MLEEKNIRFENICRKTGETIEWRYQDTEQVRLSAKREGLSGFWKAAYWYRQEDGLFLRYRSAHGAVGTDHHCISDSAGKRLVEPTGLTA